ncbi:MAG: hypothetical protein DRO36_05910 [Candidatus Hecatellales archaeon]|nr:MAG: hypothetical protein DRO36_05910 [Candidatus Hecatellales archaeon]
MNWQEKLRRPLKENENLYLIRFNLGPEVFSRGIRIEWYIEDLKSLGELILDVQEEKLPDGDEVAEDCCYVAEALLVSEEPEGTIKELLEFILDDGVHIETISTRDPSQEHLEEKAEVEEVPEQVLNDYLAETAEHLNSIENNLVRLEQQPGEPELLNELFRQFHTVKGNTGLLLSFGPNTALEVLKRIAHCSETILAKARDGQSQLSEGEVETLFEALDALRECFRCFKERKALEDRFDELTARLSASPLEGELLDTKTPKLSDEELRAFREIFLQYGSLLEELANKQELSTEEEEFFERAIRTLCNSAENLKQKRVVELLRTVKVPSDLKNIITQISKELEKAKSYESQKKITKTDTIQLESSIRVTQEQMDRLMNLVGELTAFREWLKWFVRHGDETWAKQKQLREQIQRYSRLVAEAQRTAMEMRMVPLYMLFQRFPKVVRDISKALGKKVQFEIVGEDTKIDKLMLDRLGDPLIHLVRNSLDHGIEPSEERIAQGKPEAGRLVLRAFYTTEGVAIEVEDDGRGIDPDMVRLKAVERGLRSEEEVMKLSDEEVISLIMLPGFSTKEEATELSGRGVGMDVVSSSVEAMGGKVKISSRRGEGTLVKLILPLTLAVRKVLIVRSGELLFSLPVEQLREVVNRPEFQWIADRPFMVHRDEAIPVVPLGSIFGLGDSDVAAAKKVVLLKEREEGILVDEVVGLTETVTKPMPRMLKIVEELAGISILGKGDIAYQLSL